MLREGLLVDRLSQDGVTYVTLSAGVLPDHGPEGVNADFFLQRGLQATASFVKVRILSGYSQRYWGLGEIEVFGTGAVMETDDDWYDVNTDVTGLTLGATYHYRLVATSADSTTTGEDRTFTVPATTIPEVTTGAASRIHASTAKVEGRFNALGESTEYYFDYGLTPDYCAYTERAIIGGLAYGGVGIAPRTVSAPLTGLVRDKTYHYRLVAVNATGTSFGAYATFTTP